MPYSRNTSSRRPPQRRDEKTSWEPVAKWYGKHLKDDDTYQITIVFPKTLSLLAPKKGGKYLDIACGEGSFALEVAKKGADVFGVDISSTLIRQAQEKRIHGAAFRVANAKDFARYYPEKSFDGATCILAIQNIDDMKAVFRDAAKVLRPGASFVVVMNHPVLRTPRQTSWGFDESKKMQYRRVDGYMIENEIPILAHPGKGERSERTFSYHRPLQDYVSALVGAGFVIDGLEEWTSDRRSESGERARTENRSRNEIPLFMAIRARNSR
jgi:SAM-dependent methyltransferase